MKEFCISINLTNRCNLNCSYCIADVPYNPVYNDISLTAIKFIVKMINTFISEYYSIRVYLVGGEPLIYPYLNEVIELCRSIKNIARISVCTNGSLFVNDVIKEHDLLFYSLTHHTDVIIDKHLYSYHANFIKNLEFIINNSEMTYDVKIMSDNKKVNSIKNNFINEINQFNIPQKRIKYPQIISTSHFKTETKYCNEKYNTYVYPYRAINITRDILYNEDSKVRYVMSYICDMTTSSQFKPLYSVREWQKLTERAPHKFLCNKVICPCNVGCADAS